MSIIHIFFSGRTHKEAESISDCQDQFQVNLEKRCFAIADGSSQSFYPSLWAKLLVNHFCENPDINQENWKKWLNPIQVKWLEEVTQQVEIAKKERNPVWVTNINRLNQWHSASSTFIGLQFLDNQVKVSMVGDSCLFIFKGDHSLLGAYLLKSSKVFNNRPKYFASYSKNNDFVPDCFDLNLEPELSEKIYFILATDALSEFIFKCVEQNKNICEYLLKIYSQGDFEKFVTETRQDQTLKMKNDDVTLMILELNDTKILGTLPYINKQQKKSQSYDNYKDEKSDEENQRSEETNKKLDENKPENVIKENNIIKLLTGVFSRFTTNITSNPNSNKTTPKTESNTQDDLRTLKKEIRSLKLQRNVLIILVFLLPLFTYYIISKPKPSSETSTSPTNNQTTVSTTSTTPIKPEIKQPEYTTIKLNNTIYKDKELKEVLIQSSQNLLKVLVSEKGANWLKFQVNLYAHKSNSKNGNCQDNQLELQENIRLSPDTKSQSLFGTLKEPSTFKNLESNSTQNWCKFQFEGYIKNEISVKK